MAVTRRNRSKRRSDMSEDATARKATVPTAGGEDTQTDKPVEEQAPAAKRRRLPMRTRAGAGDEAEGVEDDDKNKTLDEVEAEAKEEHGSSDDDDDDSDSDSDNAPEAISTTQAAAATRKSAQLASKAQEIRAADLKRRRQERDTRLKEQAATRKTREAAKAEKAKQEESTSAADETDAKPEKKKAAVPKLLPLEFLDSDEESDEDGDDGDGVGSTKRSGDASAPSTSRKRKAKGDMSVGGTVFRVLGKTQPQTMAPRSNRGIQGIREGFLARKRKPRTVREGFLVNGGRNASERTRAALAWRW